MKLKYKDGQMKKDKWPLLHIATMKSNINDILKILKENSTAISDCLPPAKIDETDKTKLRLGSSTALHLALINDEYEIAENIMAQPQFKSMVNAENNLGESFLILVASLSNKLKALQFSKFLIDNHADINSQSENGTPLSVAINECNLDLAHYFLSVHANPNIPDSNGITPLQKLIFKLNETTDTTLIEKINHLIASLLEHGADPTIRNLQGYNVSEYIFKFHLEHKLSDGIVKQLGPFTVDLSARRQFLNIANHTKAFRLFAGQYEQSPSINDTALLIELKRERRKKQNADYDCTTISNRETFEDFLQLTKIRTTFTHVPFETHFVIQPRAKKSIHVAVGQLSFDDKGNMNGFWVDTLGHNDNHTEKDRILTKETNKEIARMIKKYFPKIKLYTVQQALQTTKTGCHHFASYISEQLSAATFKNKNLYADLENIHQESKLCDDEFHIIPLELCPPYTGIPLMVQSASMPQERIAKDRKEDKETINRKGQSYQQAVSLALKQKKGKLTNITYDTKRLKTGRHLEHAMRTSDQNSITQKTFAGYSDVVNRIPYVILSQILEIQLIESESAKDQWIISLPKKYLSNELNKLKSSNLNYVEEEKYINLSGSITQLNQLMLEIRNDFVSNLDNVNRNNFLYSFATISTAFAVVNNELALRPELILPNETTINDVEETLINKNNLITQLRI